MAEETKGAVMVYEARDGQEITLTFDRIKRYLVQGHPEYVTPAEFMYFMGVAKSGGMNPFKRDCWLIKYSQKDNAQIITAIGFLRSRAKAQKDCKGWKAGIIVIRDKKIVYSDGLKLTGDELIGGWARGKPEGWDEDTIIEVNLDGYIKKTREGQITAFWKPEKQPTQIAKVAESQLLRTLWPDEFQNIYTNAEISPDDGTHGLPEIPEETGKEVDAEFDAEVYADAHADFDKKVPKDALPERVKEFLALVQRGVEKTTFEVKQEAFDHWDDFWASFLKWQSKNYGDAGIDLKQEVKPDPIREQYINLRTKGFKPWVMANLERIRELDTPYRKEIHAKWDTFYPGEPFGSVKEESAATEHVATPGDDSGPASEETTTEPPAPSVEEEKILSIIEGSKRDIAGRLCVPCPNTNGRAVLVSFCDEGCQERKGCPTFEAYDKNQ